MECGKLTAKLRDAVPVCFMVNDHEVKRYKNIEIPEEIKRLEYCGFQFSVPEDGGAITFKIHALVLVTDASNQFHYVW